MLGPQSVLPLLAIWLGVVFIAVVMFVVPLFEPKAATTDNTPWVSSIIDTNGFNAVELVIETGTLTDADATFAVTIEHGDASNLSREWTPRAFAISSL